VCQTDLTQILEQTWELGIDLLLLGYKHVGFGSDKTPHDMEGLETLLRLRQEKRPHWNARVSMLGVDTAFVQHFEPVLQELKIPTVLRTAEEGKFSMYVDAVTCTQGPSSYMPDHMQPLVMMDLVNSMKQAYVTW